MLILLPFLNSATAWAADRPKPTEYEVKAAYLLNFGKFVQWPTPHNLSADNRHFFICVLGRDPFGLSLDATLAGETVTGKNVIGKHIASAQEALGCQVLFISSSEEGHIGDILHTLSRAPILTVSDVPRFSGQGGMIQFLTEENRIRFEVNLDAAQQAGLSLSSQLLKVAVHVRTSRHSGD